MPPMMLSPTQWRHMATLVLGSTTLLGLITCPHIKVEESFHLQATHDFYYHLYHHSNASSIRDVIELFDHLQYPGVVPRSFVGSFLLASVCQLVTYPLQLCDVILSPMTIQFLARLILGSCHVACIARFAYAIDQSLEFRHVPYTGGCMLLVSAVQFHVPYYSTRTLPNSFALTLVTLAYSYWIEKRCYSCCVWLLITVLIFRCDVAILLCTVGLMCLWYRQISLLKSIRIGIFTTVLTLTLCIPFDSMLWKRLVWAEGEVLWFNTVDNKSSEWGTEVWHWYFSSAIPKAMLLTLLLVPAGFIKPNLVFRAIVARIRGQLFSMNQISSFIDLALMRFLLPVLSFVTLYSFLPHKEMRFIFPALPIMNLVAGMGLARCGGAIFPSNLSAKEIGKQGLKFEKAFNVLVLSAAVGFVLLTLFASICFIRVSSSNYPGGSLMTNLIQYVQQEESSNTGMVYVHIDLLAAMTGVTLFLQRQAQFSYPQVEWKFDKAGYELENNFSHYETELTYTHILSEIENIEGYHVVATSKGNPRLDWKQMEIKTDDVLFLHVPL